MLAQIITIAYIFVCSHIVSPIYVDEIQINQDVINFHGDPDQCSAFLHYGVFHLSPLLE